jgi:hypothetical protein
MTSAPLAEGDHTIVVTVTDAAGNQTSVTQALKIVLVPAISLSLNLAIGGTVAGSEVTVDASNMMPDSEWTLTMHSSPVVVATGRTDSAGNIRSPSRLPSIIELGSHRLILDAIKPDGVSVQIVTYLNIGAHGDLSYVGPVVNPAGDGPVDLSSTTVPSPSTSSTEMPAAVSRWSNVPLPFVDGFPVDPFAATAQGSAAAAQDEGSSEARACVVTTVPVRSDVTTVAAAKTNMGHQGAARSGAIGGATVEQWSTDCVNTSLGANVLALTETTLGLGGVAGIMSAMAMFGFIAARRRRKREDSFWHLAAE